MKKTGPRLIKKYPNRRLYDQETSCFLTLDGVRKLVVENVPFQVIDAKNGHDITRAILLQVLADEEEKGVPIFSTNLLLMIIRLYGNNLHVEFSRFIERSFSFFLKQQDTLGAKLGRPLLNPVKPGVAIISTLTEMAEKNLNLWQEWQRGIPFPLEMWSPGGDTGDKDGTGDMDGTGNMEGTGNMDDAGDMDDTATRDSDLGPTPDPMNSKATPISQSSQDATPEKTGHEEKKVAED
ncbi:MAG: polyhydroxyalkanoate synthesis repressor PhaR [Magnetococcus sp. DMHC-1]